MNCMHCEKRLKTRGTCLQSDQNFYIELFKRWHLSNETLTLRYFHQKISSKLTRLFSLKM